MNNLKLSLFLTLLMSMVGAKAFAYHAYINGIYYIFSGSEAIVTYHDEHNFYGGYRGKVIIPESVTNNGKTYSVTTIGESAFTFCSNLTDIVIPNSVTSIGRRAFYDCSGLTGIVIPNSVTSIGSGAFSGCSSLTSIVIPNSVTSIGEHAFSRCSLRSATIGAGVLSIGLGAFDYNQPTKVIWLTNTPPAGYREAVGTVNYVANNLYSSLRNTTVYPFLSSIFEVDGVKYVPVSPSERTCDAIDCLYNEQAANVHIGQTVSFKGIQMKVLQVHKYACYANDSIKTVKTDLEGDVNEYAFYECKNIKEADVNNVGMIGGYAFNKCANLETLSIGGQVTNIGDYAFAECGNMITATIGEGITSIGKYAFGNCLSLEKIRIPDAVATLGEYAFYENSKLQQVQMGTGLKIINSGTFSYCSELTDMQIGRNVQTIDGFAFEDCSKLPLIDIPSSVTKINDQVFRGCSALKTVLMANGNSNLALGRNWWFEPLFSDCPLDSVYIGRNISYSTASNSGYSPFYRNTSLRAVCISDKETEISDNEFYGCTNLKNVYIGDGVTSIGNWAFSGCNSLDYFAFGSQVKSIGKEAFSDCTAVTNIYSRAAVPPTCGTQALDDINKWSCSLHVPEGRLKDYQAAEQWKEFFFMDELAGISSTTVSAPTEVSRHLLNGQRATAPQHGINIIHMSDGSVKKLIVR